jgi:hypothetical protein
MLNRRTDPRVGFGNPFGVYDNNILCEALNNTCASTRVYALLLSSYDRLYVRILHASTLIFATCGLISSEKPSGDVDVDIVSLPTQEGPTSHTWTCYKLNLREVDNISLLLISASESMSTVLWTILTVCSIRASLSGIAISRIPAYLCPPPSHNQH